MSEFSPLVAEPDDRESVESYLLRCAALNRIKPMALFRARRLGWRQEPRLEDANELTRALGISTDWLTHRIFSPSGFQRWRCDWAGMRWRTPDLVSRRYTKLCPECVHADGILRLEWQLNAVCACAKHRRLLVQHCGSCNELLSWNRPAVDVCNCMMPIARSQDDCVEEGATLALVGWLGDCVQDASCASEMPDVLKQLLPGAPSPDGAWRCVHIFGVIPDVQEELDADLEFPRPPSPAETWTQLKRGLARLRQLDEEGLDSRLVHATQLRLQTISGVSEEDRALARHLAFKAGVPLGVYSRTPGHQLGLFK